MRYITCLTLFAALPMATAAALEPRAACSSYTLINTRGTGEPQGESRGFTTMNTNILAQLPGGKKYNTVYPAGNDQNSTSGSIDILNHIQQAVAANPGECFILEGYSQGAAATVDALPYIVGNYYYAVRGIFLIGNPLHKPGYSCNVDIKGGNSTFNVTGFEAYRSIGIPSQFVPKSLDVCNFADVVCDNVHPSSSFAQHLVYPTDPGTQNMGTKFALSRLRASA